MIYITGDTHGEFDRFTEAKIQGESSWTREDVLIVCGDFGFVFRNDEAEQEQLNSLSMKPYTICFIDGNHENFPALFEYPEELWQGGRIHRIRPNIIHLMRGQVYTIQGQKIFTMGGAFSTDRRFRRLGKSYWEEEIPVHSEYDEATRNLKQHNNQVDMIITHTAPQEILQRLGFFYDESYAGEKKDNELTGYLGWMMYEVDYQKWFFGHLHIDQEINPKITALWFNVVQARDQSET